ncbi:MAG: hypothetical protein ACLSTU_12610 [Oscillospiraceae bacterium]|jgi:hypothetical protein
MADYFINSDKGRDLANSMGAGEVRDASDGSTWIKNSDGSVTVWKNGVKMTGVVGESTPAEPVTPEYTPEQPTSIDTPVLDSTSQTAPSVQQDTVQTPTLNERIQTAREKAKEATSKVTEGLYTIGTELGKSYADQLQNAGDTKLLSDGYTLRRDEDGGYSASKNGQSVKVRIDEDAVRRDSLMNEAIRGAFSQNSPYTVGTEAGLDLLEQAKSTGSTVWAPDNSEWAYTGNGFTATKNGQTQAITVDKDAIRKAAQKKAQALPDGFDGEYRIGSADGVSWVDGNRQPGEMLGGRDDSLWIWEGPDNVVVLKGDKTYKGVIDREAAARDTQQAAAPVSAGTGSAGGSYSGGSGTYVSSVSNAGKSAAKSSTAANSTDVATLRKQAATAQRDMADIARQISAGKARKKDTSALEAKYAEAKSRYDTARAQINAASAELTLVKKATAPEIKAAAANGQNARDSYSVQYTDTPSRAEVMRSYQERKEEAQKEARENAWKSLPTVADADRFTINEAADAQTRGAEQQFFASARRELQQNAWRSLPTVRDSERFSIPSQTDSLMQQAIAQRQSAAQPQTDKGIGGKLFTMLGAGLGQFNASIANFADAAATTVETVESYLNGGFTKDGKFVKGDSAFTSSLLQPIHNWAKYTQRTSDSLNERSAANWSDTKAGSVANTIGTGVIAALPQAALALLTLGTSSAGTLTQASSGLAGSIETVMRRISSDPSYWLSFMQETGGNFAEAKGAGATDEQAILASTIAGLANAAIEVGGGLENNDWMNDGTLSALSKAKNLIKGAIEEGGEELIQNPISRAMQKLVYDGDREWLSLDNTAQGRDAVFNPYQSAEEFATGAAVGGILGAGNFALNRALGSRSQNQARNTQLTQDEMLDASIQAALRGETLTDPAQAENQNTQQTTQPAQERGAEGVITGGESGPRSGVSNQSVRSERSAVDQAVLAALTGQDIRTVNQMGTNNAYASAEENAAARPYTHERVSNAEQFARANGRILTDADGNVSNYAGQVQELLAADHWNNTDRDVAATLRHEAFQRGDMDSFYRLSDRITETNTEAGRTLQGTQKWLEQAHPEQSVVAAAKKALDTNPKAPSGKMAFIEKTAREISGFGDNVSQWAGALRQIAEERRMTGVDMLVRIAEKQGANDPRWLKSLVYNGLYNVAGDYEKPTGAVDTVNKGLRRLKSYVITNQLFRITTNAANVVSNSISNATEAAAANTGTAHLADAIMGKFTGLRSHGAFENVLGKEALTTGKNLAQKSFVEIWLDTSTEGTDSKFQSSKGRAVREYKMTGNQLFSTIDAVLSTALNTTDAFATGVSQGAAQTALRRNVQKGYLTAEQALDVAKQRGSDTTFHNKTALGTTLQRVQAAMNCGLEYGAGNIVAGNYLNVPAAVLMREVSKMPTIGTVGALIDMAAVCIDGKTGKNTIGDLQAKITGEKLTLAQRQSRAAQQLGRSLALGTMEVAGYAALALKGIIRRVDDDDKDKAAFEAAGGQQGLYINWSALWRSVPGGDSEWQDGDVITNLGRLEPLTVNMNFGIDVAEALKTDEGLRAEDLKGISISAVQDGIADLSMIQNIQGIINALQYKGEDQSAFEAVGQELLASNVASLTPGLIQQAAKAIDPYYRDLYTGDTSGQQIYDIWANTIPGLRQQLPEKLTGFGTPKEYAGTGTEQAVNALLNPYATTTVRPKTGMESMLQEAEDVSVYPNRNPIGSVSVNGQTVTLTNEQKRQYQTVYGQTYRDTLQALQGSIAFRQLDRQAKDAAMKAAESYAGTAAKTALDIGYKPPEDYAARIGMDGAALANALILEAVKAQHYLSGDTKKQLSGVEGVYGSTAYARQSLDVVNAAKEKATAYFEHVEQAKYGGELTEAEQELVGKDSEYIADYFMRKAIDSYKNTDGTSGHLSGDNAVKYAAVAKKLDGPTFAGVGIFGDILTEAKKKAHSFYTEVEKTGFGGIMSADNRALNRKFAKMSDDEIAQHFLSIAAKESFKDTNGNGTNLDEAAAALKSGKINDPVVFALLDTDTIEDYNRYGKGSSITTEILLQAARAKKTVKQDTDQDSVVVNTSQEQFEDWVNRQSWTQQQKQDVMKVFYPNTAEKKNYLVESLNSGKMKYTDAKKELTPTLQAGWTHQLLPTLDANANDTTKGALMSHYIEAAAAYDDRPNAAERKALNYSYAWQWFCDYLNTTDMTREQKYQIALILSGTDSQRTKDKIWSRLR